MRTPDGNYVYSIDHKYYPHGLINRPGGSSLRNPGCNYALHLFDERMGIDGLRVGLQQLVDNHRFAIAGLRRPRPHESWYAVSGYFYLYGHQYAATSMAVMPKADQQKYWPHIVRSTLKTRQNDWIAAADHAHRAIELGQRVVGQSRLAHRASSFIAGKRTRNDIA